MGKCTFRPLIAGEGENCTLGAGDADAFPLLRGGGAFLVAIGLGIVVGSVGNRRWRLVSLIVGAGVGVLITAVSGTTKVIFDGPPYPAIWQWVVLGIAFLAEGLMVNIVLRRVPDVTSRNFWMWILFIVGVHFLIHRLQGLLGDRRSAQDRRWRDDGGTELCVSSPLRSHEQVTHPAVKRLADRRQR